MARLGDVFPLVRNGASIKQTDGAAGIPITRIETISNREIDRNKFGYADIIDDSKYKDYILQDGDILMSHINSEKHLGKVALYKKQGNEQIIHGMNLLMLRANPSVLFPPFAIYFFETSAFLLQIKKITKKSVNQASFTVKSLKEVEIPLPPIDEQRKIATVLDKVSDLIAKRKQQLDKLDELVQSRFIEMFGDPQSNPHGYQYAKLSDIATYFNGLTYKPENVAEEGTIVLRSSNIQNSQLDFADTVRVNCAIKKRLMVKENDILMCSRNGSAKLVGKVALIKGIQEPTSFGAFMMIIRSQYFGYLMTYFQMDAFRQQIKTGATTTINQITGRMLDDVTIPLPPMALVEQFTAFVAQTDKSKLAIQESLKRLEILKKSLMQKYFG